MFVDLLGALVFAVWLYLLLARGGFWRMRDARKGPQAPRRRVAVIVPARNEAGVVASAVASILKQDYNGTLHVFLVDDHSRDGTAEAASEAARTSGRPELLTVVRAGPLPSGWTGKLWALSEGVRQAESFAPDFLWFTDADIVHAPSVLAGLLGRAENGPRDLVSLMVRLRCESPAERTLLPAFLFFFFKLYPPAWIADRRRPTAGAAGGCLLIRASVLSRTGGLAAIRSEVIDDCALARKVKRSGGLLWLGLTSQSRSLRPYGSFAEIGRMISRTAFAQLKHSAWLLLGTVFGMLLLYAAPPLLAIAAHGPARVCGAAAWVLMTIAYAPSLRFYRRSAAWAPLLPLAALFYTGATLHSAVRYWRGAGGTWKGRAQDVRSR